jgi:hypothetical protein
VPEKGGAGRGIQNPDARRGRNQGGGQAPGQGRGQGSGRGGGRMGGRGGGPGGECICQQCGRTMPHQRGVPCMEISCPDCGIPMTRKW